MQHNVLATAVLLGSILASCSSERKDFSKLPDEALRRIADSVAKVTIITDGHVDLPYRLRVKNFRLEKEFLTIPIKTSEGDFDYERAKKGGLDAPFMSIYIASSYNQTPDKAKAHADSLIDLVVGITKAHPDKFALANSPDDIIANTQAGKISLPMGMENGSPIGNDINNVHYLFTRGIRYVTLTHSKDNQISDSSYDSLNTWNGLSPFGEQVIEAMNKEGIMVDVSHISDSAFYDVMRLSKAPVIASHSSCRHFTPGFQRNMSDEMLRTLAKNDGVIQINFGANFIDSIARTHSALRDSLESVLQSQHLTSKDEAAAAIIAGFGFEHKVLFADVERVADHIDHVVQVAGIDHVGLGSDFDGVGDSLPLGLKDVSQYPNLIFVLLKRGYSLEDIEKICYQNVFRVWNKVIDISAH
jgi:membrane dipeptidase